MAERHMNVCMKHMKGCQFCEDCIAEKDKRIKELEAGERIVGRVKGEFQLPTTVPTIPLKHNGG